MVIGQQKEDKQRELEAAGEDQSESGGGMAEVEIRPGQDGSSSSTGVQYAEKEDIGTALAEQDDENSEQDVTLPGKDANNMAVGQQPTKHREFADGVEVDEDSGGGAAEGEDGANQDGSRRIDIDINIDIGLEMKRLIETGESQGSENGQPKEDTVSRRDAMGDGQGQPQATCREQRNGSNEKISGGGGLVEDGGVSVASSYRSASFEGDGDTSVRCYAIQNHLNMAKGQGYAMQLEPWVRRLGMYVAISRSVLLDGDNSNVI